MVFKNENINPCIIMLHENQDPCDHFYGGFLQGISDLFGDYIS